MYAELDWNRPIVSWCSTVYEGNLQNVRIKSLTDNRIDQEQCIELGQVMAGYSLGMADLRIRKVLGKKLVKKIPEIRNEFIYGKKSLFDEEGNVIGVSEEDSPYCIGAIRNGFSEEVATKIFDIMEEFAKYSFENI